MLRTLEALDLLLPALMRQTGAKTLFEASIFDSLITMAARLRDNDAGTRVKALARHKIEA